MSVEMMIIYTGLSVFFSCTDVLLFFDESLSIDPIEQVHITQMWLSRKISTEKQQATHGEPFKYHSDIITMYYYMPMYETITHVE